VGEVLVNCFEIRKSAISSAEPFFCGQYGMQLLLVSGATFSPLWNRFDESVSAVIYKFTKRIFYGCKSAATNCQVDQKHFRSNVWVIFKPKF
jgi:hypothetical protein